MLKSPCRCGARNEGYLNEFTSERAWGEDGYLAEKGMIPLPIAERRAMAESTDH